MCQQKYDMSDIILWLSTIQLFLSSFQVFHYLSLALLTFFMVELSGKIYAYRLEFLHHKFEVFDGIVVVVSFILDIVYISKEDAFDAMGLLILLRLWRVARIINGTGMIFYPAIEIWMFSFLGFKKNT